MDQMVEGGGNPDVPCPVLFQNGFKGVCSKGAQGDAHEHHNRRGKALVSGQDSLVGGLGASGAAGASGVGTGGKG